MPAPGVPGSHRRRPRHGRGGGARPAAGEPRRPTRLRPGRHRRHRLLVVVVILTFLVAALPTDAALGGGRSAPRRGVPRLPHHNRDAERGKSLGSGRSGCARSATTRDRSASSTRLVRALVAVVEIYALGGGPAFFSALLSARGKRLGDYAAGTYVVRERVRFRLTPPPAMPLELAAWARAPTSPRCRPGWRWRSGSSLARLAGLDPASRATVGTGLAQQAVAVRRSARRRRAPRPRRSSRRSSRPAASATRPGWAASARSASGSLPEGRESVLRPAGRGGLPRDVDVLADPVEVGRAHPPGQESVAAPVTTRRTARSRG